MNTKTSHFCHKMTEKNEVKDAYATVYAEAIHNITEARMRIGTAKTDLTKLWSLQPRSSQARALKADVMSLKEFWHVIHQNCRRRIAFYT